MAKKYSDYTEDEQSNITEHMDAMGTQMGMSTWETTDHAQNIKKLKELFGLCANCLGFRYCMAEYGGIMSRVVSFCNVFKMSLSSDHIITECNQHESRTMLNLSQMKEIAWYFNRDRREIGFGGMREKTENHAKAIEIERKRKDAERNKQLGII